MSAMGFLIPQSCRWELGRNTLKIKELPECQISVGLKAVFRKFTYRGCEAWPLQAG